MRFSKKGSKTEETINEIESVENESENKKELKLHQAGPITEEV